MTLFVSLAHLSAQENLEEALREAAAREKALAERAQRAELALKEAQAQLNADQERLAQVLKEAEAAAGWQERLVGDTVVHLVRMVCLSGCRI